jgi:hypothetical protein
MRLVDDFLKMLIGDLPSISTTSLDDSINGHLIGFYADRSMEKGSVEIIDSQGRLAPF